MISSTYIIKMLVSGKLIGAGLANIALAGAAIGGGIVFCSLIYGGAKILTKKVNYSL